jgi:rubredoxin
VKCSLCGYEFEENESLAVCGACILRKSCNMVCCPNCGYEMPKPRKIKLFKKKKEETQK